MEIADSSIDLDKINGRSGFKVHGDKKFFIQTKNAFYMQLKDEVRGAETYNIIYRAKIEKTNDSMSPFVVLSPELFQALASQIFVGSRYSLQAKQAILSAIANFPASDESTSINVRYEDYLHDIPVEELSSIPELALYVTLRKESTARDFGLWSIELQPALRVQESLRTIEKQYADYPMPETVLLFVNQLGGFGDLMAAAKTAKIILQESPKTKVVIFRVDDYMKIIDFSKDYEELIGKQLGCYSKNCSFGGPDSSIPADHSVAIGVASLKSNRMKQLSYLKNIPWFCVPEYDLPIPDRPEQYFSGLSMKAIGIFVEEDALAPLTDVQRGILASYHLQEGQFYFGYATCLGPVCKFLDTLINYTRESLEPMNVVIKCTQPPGLSRIPFDKCATKDHLKKTIADEVLKVREQLAGKNIGTVCIDGKVIFQGPGKTLNITLIDDPGIPHEHMITLIKASKELCLLTGDQSFSEGISMKKIIMYEKHYHKDNFYSQHYRSIGGLAVGYQYGHFLSKMGFSYDDVPKLNDAFTSCLADELKEPEIQESYGRVSAEIVNHHNIRKNLLLLTKAFYAGWKPSNIKIYTQIASLTPPDL